MSASSSEKESFKKRAADVFGSLDRLAPSRLSRPPVPSPTRSNSDGRGVLKTSTDLDAQERTGTARRHLAGGRSRSRPERTGETERDSVERLGRGPRRDICSPPLTREGGRMRKRQRTHPHAPVPGYVRHPEKWKRYDLTEDGTESMKGLSEDQVNRAAAFNFLGELRARKVAAAREDEKPFDTSGASGSQPVLFRKPMARSSHLKPRPHSTSLKQNLQSSEAAKEILRGTDVAVDEKFGAVGGDAKMSSRMEGQVLKMPEYVVGAKTARKRRKLELLTTAEEDEDEEEAEGGKGVEPADQDGVKKLTDVRRLPLLSHLNMEDEEDVYIPD